MSRRDRIAMSCHILSYTTLAYIFDSSTSILYLLCSQVATIAPSFSLFMIPVNKQSRFPAWTILKTLPKKHVRNQVSIRYHLFAIPTTLPEKKGKKRRKKKKKKKKKTHPTLHIHHLPLQHRFHIRTNQTPRGPHSRPKSIIGNRKQRPRRAHVKHGGNGSSVKRPHGIEIFARDGEAIGDFGGRRAEEFGRGDFEGLEPGDEEVFGFGFGGV